MFYGLEKIFSLKNLKKVSFDYSKEIVAHFSWHFEFTLGK